MANGNSKRERVESFIGREVRRALREIAFDSPNSAEFLRTNARTIELHVTCGITSDPYRMRELQDIMDWKKPPKL